MGPLTPVTATLGAAVMHVALLHPRLFPPPPRRGMLRRGACPHPGTACSGLTEHPTPAFHHPIPCQPREGGPPPPCHPLLGWPHTGDGSHHPTGMATGSTGTPSTGSAGEGQDEPRGGGALPWVGWGGSALFPPPPHLPEQRALVETHLSRIRNLEQQLRQRDGSAFPGLGTPLPGQEVPFLTLHPNPSLTHGELPPHKRFPAPQDPLWSVAGAEPCLAPQCWSAPGAGRAGGWRQRGGWRLSWRRRGRRPSVPSTARSISRPSASGCKRS